MKTPPITNDLQQAAQYYHIVGDNNRRVEISVFDVEFAENLTWDEIYHGA